MIQIDSDRFTKRFANRFTNFHVPRCKHHKTWWKEKNNHFKPHLRWCLKPKDNCLAILRTCPFWDGENVTLQKVKLSDLQPRDQVRSWLESHGVLCSFLTNLYLLWCSTLTCRSYLVAHFAHHLHPWKLTCPLKSDHFSREYIFQPSIFRGHVSFQGSSKEIGHPNSSWMHITS